MTLVEEPKYDFDTPLGVIVLEELRIDERFTKLKVIREANYDEDVIPYICSLIENVLEDCLSMICDIPFDEGRRFRNGCPRNLCCGVVGLNIYRK